MSNCQLNIFGKIFVKYKTNNKFLKNIGGKIMTMLRLWKEPFEDKVWNDPFISMIDRFFESPSFIDRGYKRSNILTTDDEYKIQLAVPGLTKEDVKIGIDGSVITISHEKEQTDDKSFYFTSSFKKEYQLPEDIDDEKIYSKLENGILDITIPRTKKKKNERYIEIE